MPDAPFEVLLLLLLLLSPSSYHTRTTRSFLCDMPSVHGKHDLLFEPPARGQARSKTTTILRIGGIKRCSPILGCRITAVLIVNVCRRQQSVLPLTISDGRARRRGCQKRERKIGRAHHDVRAPGSTPLAASVTIGIVDTALILWLFRISICLNVVPINNVYTACMPLDVSQAYSLDFPIAGTGASEQVSHE